MWQIIQQEGIRCQASAASLQKEGKYMIEDGQTVRVHYEGTLSDGTQFDSSRGRDPLEFIMGSGSLIPGFENAVRNLEKGGSCTVTIPAEQAYGPYDNLKVYKVPLSEFPAEMKLSSGQRLRVQTEQGIHDMVVRDVQEDGVILDGNHPLAGQDLTFAIEVVEVF